MSQNLFEREQMSRLVLKLSVLWFVSVEEASKIANTKSGSAFDSSVQDNDDYDGSHWDIIPYIMYPCYKSDFITIYKLWYNGKKKQPRNAICHH